MLQNMCMCVKISEDNILEYIVAIWDMIMIEMKWPGFENKY